MRLNTQTDYALRLLMHLAVNPGTLVTIAEVSEHYGISKNHLMKIAQTLGQLGYIDTVRGRAGGLRLAYPAARINVGTIVRHIEGDFALVECFAGRDGTCRITAACRLSSVLKQAVEAFLQVLDQYSVENLVADNSQLWKLLKSEAV
ncbi:Rrf2 family transcriptional regulator [Sneathiella marina]|uniref:Rrf2 family transcriptional regulator n=1 Tax=Sneathiella marina TaxID=2950108 RepID=A0ABY4VZX0_9PROT|nr:Rrf2 family transcriptional regulator [Sneathiella marina]USG60166.1 Rrf2 family transcriptional regulator [Sneathiella marina]